MEAQPSTEDFHDPLAFGGSQTNIARKSNLKKDDDVASHRSSYEAYPGHGHKETFNHLEGRGFGRSRDQYEICPPSSKPKDMPMVRPLGRDYHHREREPGYGYSHSYEATGDFHGGAMPYRGSYDPDPYDRRPGDRYTEWRRYGDYPSPSPYHHSGDPVYGRYKRPPETHRGMHRGMHPADRRNRLISEEPRMSRAFSHERMDSGPLYSGGGSVPWDNQEEMFLSQPNPSFFGGGYDRPGFNPMMGGASGMGPGQGMMGFDPRTQMAGPLGHSLSQPGEHAGGGAWCGGRSTSVAGRAKFIR